MIGTTNNPYGQAGQTETYENTKVLYLYLFVVPGEKLLDNVIHKLYIDFIQLKILILCYN